MKYEDLKRFILEEMRVHENYNYQPVMIKTLNQNNGKATRQLIQVELHYANPERPPDYFSNSPVFDVLTQSHPIVKYNPDTKEYVLLDYDTYTPAERAWITMYCDEIINELKNKTKSQKIAICWPTDKDDDKIEKFSEVIQKNYKTLWGVNWNAPRISKSDYPLKGYLYYRGQIIAIANIVNITETSSTAKDDLELRPKDIGYENEKWSHYLHLSEIKRCEPFPHKRLELFDPEKKMPDVIQQRVYVKEIPTITNDFRCWIWSVTPENWEIVKQKQIWASKIVKNLREKVRPGDKVVFYVIGSNEFQGIFELSGEWYDAQFPVWDDEKDSIIYKSQIHLIQLKFGNVNVYEIAPKLSIFPNSNDKRMISLVLKGGGGYPSNNGKPIPYADYMVISSAMNDNLESSSTNYWKISPGKQAEDWENQLKNGVIAIGWSELGDLSNVSQEDLNQRMRENYPDLVAQRYQIDNFLKIKKGDIILANKGQRFIVGIGRVIGNYKYNQKLKFAHTYPIEWFDTKERQIPIQHDWYVTVLPVSKVLYEQILSGIYLEENYLLLRYTEKPSKYSDLFGHKYEYGKIANYTKISLGTKAIWFDRIDGQFVFSGHGIIDHITQNGDSFIATMKDFVTFVPQKLADDLVQGKITKQPGYNVQNSILPITREIYEQILGIEETLDEDQIATFDDEPLPIPQSEDLKIGYTKISNELLIPEEKIIEIVTALASGRHVLLAGPIGTGKTELAIMIPQIFWEKYGGYYSEDHTATSDWSTQDVIGGIFPKMNESGQPIYEIQNGCVVETVQKNWLRGVDGGPRRASEDPTKTLHRGTWLIIDEFNRADIDKAFGQLFTALRTHTLKIPTDKKGKSYKILKIPQDYRIIGTLNTVDKHFLFQLSDALKSRFAYIEIDIPKPSEIDTEIYYAMKNAISELKKERYDDLVVLDHQNKKVDKDKSNPEFYNRAYQAYHFLDSIRLFKKLGTAILKLVYQNMLTGTQMTKDTKTALDNALTSTLIPQLENLPQSAVGSIHALYNNDLVKFFKDAYKHPNRQSYSDAFTKIVNYLQLQAAPRLASEFTNGTLQVDNDSTWQPIQTAYDAKKKEFEMDLEQLKQSMTDLVQSMII